MSGRLHYKKISSGTLLLLATYWPYPPQIQQDEMGLKLFTLTQQYLSPGGGIQSPLEHVHQAISDVATQHMSHHDGKHVILGGDFNSTWRGRKLGGWGCAPPLRRWTRDGGWRSWRNDLPDICPPVTRPSSRLTSGCEIDHVFTPSSYNVGIGSGWVGLSDHHHILDSYAITRLASCSEVFPTSLRSSSNEPSGIFTVQTAISSVSDGLVGTLSSPLGLPRLNPGCSTLTLNMTATLQAAPVKRRSCPVIG